MGYTYPCRHVPHFDNVLHFDMYPISTNRTSVWSIQRDDGQIVKRTFVIKTDKSALSKKLYLLKGLIVVEPKIGVKLSEWVTCRNQVHVEKGNIVEMVYMYPIQHESGHDANFPPMWSGFWIFSANTYFSKLGTVSKWGTCTPFSMRFLAVYWLKKQG